MNFRDALLYEINSSRWVSFVPSRYEWLSSLAGRYFAWKTARKWNRYLWNTERPSRIAALREPVPLVRNRPGDSLFLYIRRADGKWLTSCHTTGAPQWTDRIEDAETEHVMDVELIVRANPGCSTYTEFEMEQLKKVSYEMILDDPSGSSTPEQLAAAKKWMDSTVPLKDKTKR